VELLIINKERIKNVKKTLTQITQKQCKANLLWIFQDSTVRLKRYQTETQIIA